MSKIKKIIQRIMKPKRRPPVRREINKVPRVSNYGRHIDVR